MNNKTSTWNVKMFSEFEADRLQYRALLSEASVMSNCKFLLCFLGYCRAHLCNWLKFLKLNLMLFLHGARRIGHH